MRTEYLDYFTKVVETGTISAAAEQLYISPQGLSQAIQQLEKDFGTDLFYRSGTKLHLTAAGTEAYRLAQDVLRSCDTLQHRMGSYRLQNTCSQSSELFLCSAPFPLLPFSPRLSGSFTAAIPMSPSICRSSLSRRCCSV